MSYAVTALLECSTAAMDGSSIIKEIENDSSNATLTDDEREDLETIQAFNVAFDALNSNGSSCAVSTMTSMDGGIEGSDLTNLVNGGNMTGTTGLGAGIRLAMTLQRNIMGTARNLVERNAITRLSHFRYAYIHCSGGGGDKSTQSAGSAVAVTPEHKDGQSTSVNSSRSQYHVFAKPLVLTKLAQFL